MEKGILSCILAIKWKERMQPAASKLNTILSSCNTGREEFQQQYFLSCLQLDPSLREDVLERLFQEQ